MIDGIEQLYGRIAESIQNAIPEEWETAEMEAVFYPNSISYLGEYTRLSDGIARGFTIDLPGQRAFRELRQLFNDAGKPLWGRVCFQLTSVGKFKLQWGYEGCDSDGYAVVDEDAEVRKIEERQKRLSR